MKQRPIIFNSEMVNAILEERKTQTRRQLKPQPDGIRQSVFAKSGLEDLHGHEIRIPYQIGDQLWVRETWNRTNPNAAVSVYYYRADGKFPERFGGQEYSGDEKWKPSIHMPRCASRIILEITDIRVERLRDISEQDCVAEGIGSPFTRDCKKPQFQQLWNSIYNNWNDNPYVFVISFKRI